MRGTSFAILGIGVCASSVSALAQTAGSEVDTSYADKIVGQSVIADTANPLSDAIVVSQEKTADSISITVVHRRSFCTGESDIIERTTVRAAEGTGAFGTAMTAINVVNPMAWLMRGNMIEKADQSVHMQKTQTVMRFHGSIRSRSCDSPVTDEVPVANEALTLKAAGDTAKEIRTDEHGIATIHVSDVALDVSRAPELEVYAYKMSNVPLARISFKQKQATAASAAGHDKTR